ncbi:hypothetical protein IEQ34_015110 [Dendrobium chrysotoxum]|uniref:Uncharacterized protein n=1 Tax=Dendrobium chrysotoxum TaxID=161865 RepID=A0AAV7GNV6_DENCH|nr:hypothetical protein IEQ34_015110 [Dendrobium chrysotoxum]
MDLNEKLAFNRTQWKKRIHGVDMLAYMSTCIDCGKITLQLAPSISLMVWFLVTHLSSIPCSKRYYLQSHHATERCVWAFGVPYLKCAVVSPYALRHLQVLMFVPAALDKSMYRAYPHHRKRRTRFPSHHTRKKRV